MLFAHNNEIADDLSSFERQCLVIICVGEPRKPVLRRLIAFAMEPAIEDSNITEAALQALIISGYLRAAGDNAVVVTEQAHLWMTKLMAEEQKPILDTMLNDCSHPHDVKRRSILYPDDN
jgi:RNase P/RNase MRP subunit POP5